MLLKLRFTIIVFDYLLLIGAFAMAYFTRVGFLLSSDFPFRPYFWTSVAAAAVWIAALLIFRGYHPAIRFSRWIHLIKVVIAGLTGTAVFGLIFYFSQKALFSRLLLLYIFLFGTFTMIIFHLLMQLVENTLIRKGYGNIRLLLIGSNRGIKNFIKVLIDRSSPYVPIAVLDGYGTQQKEIHGVPVLGKLNILEEIVDQHHIDAIVQGDNIEQVVNIHSFCQKQGLDYYLLPYLFGAYQGELQIRLLEQPVISPKSPSHRSLWEKILS